MNQNLRTPEQSPSLNDPFVELIQELIECSPDTIATDFYSSISRQVQAIRGKSDA